MVQNYAKIFIIVTCYQLQQECRWKDSLHRQPWTAKWRQNIRLWVFFIHKPWSKPNLEYQAASRKYKEVCGTKSELWHLVWSRCSYVVLPRFLRCIAITRRQWTDNTVLHNAFTVVWTRFGHLRDRVQLRQLYVQLPQEVVSSGFVMHLALNL